MWSLYALREDNPRDALDMRHYGTETKAVVLQAVLNAVCGLHKAILALFVVS